MRERLSGAPFRVRRERHPSNARNPSGGASSAVVHVEYERVGGVAASTAEDGALLNVYGLGPSVHLLQGVWGEAMTVPHFLNVLLYKNIANYFLNYLK